MTPQVITSSTDLDHFVSNIASSSWLALDTEFMRESTYYPKLCLIQVATEQDSACIDVLTLEHIDPLIDLLKQTSQRKIFHSSRQDLEVLYSDFGFVPEPLFDTQIAASILGLDEQISYAELVSQILDIQLPKSQSRTDWSRRPLSSAQIEYALDDVRYLGPMHLKLMDALDTQQRMHWHDEESEKLLIESNYYIAPDVAWKLVKGTGKLPKKQLYWIQKIAAWRESTAITKNLPRRWILSDRTIVDLTYLTDFSGSAISECIQNDSPKSLRHVDAIADLLQKDIVTEELDDIVVPLDRRLNKPQQALVKALMTKTRERAAEMNTSSSLLANRKSLVDLVLGQPSKVSKGWRKSEIGDELIKILEEKLKI